MINSVKQIIKKIQESRLSVDNILPCMSDEIAREGDYSYISSSKDTIQQLVNIPIADIKTEPANKIYTPTIDKYIQDPGTKHPVVYQDSVTGEFILDDGHHRLITSEKQGNTTILVWLRKGLTNGMHNPRLDTIPARLKSDSRKGVEHD